ncbi:RagB/SusD family nutrient uptake outer membrane protein [Compostibacter hankyongensis]|uniref:RagB/SusD family nutrient uptake outer membrane protein n=1 Tax=Compostibacter hankyongensis TaxID=1007089 RepID=A0ABP8FFS4_9BACT
MKSQLFYKTIVMLSFAALAFPSCTRLDQHVYSVVPNGNFWQTPEEIAAGIAPAYQALTAIPDGSVFNISEVSSDECIVPTRGSDWYDGGEWQQLWLHTWTAQSGQLNNAWNDIYNGIGKINFALSQVDSLPEPPENLAGIDAELKTLRAYYYFLAMDLFGNVPLVTSFNTDPNSVTNVPRADVFDFIEKELKDNLDLLPVDVSGSTYGRVTKWMAFALLGKLYLNAQVYTGKARWADCMAMCDSIIESAGYTLMADYFDNFSTDNEKSTENIFVVPFDRINISGNGWEMNTLHYQNNVNFGLSGSPYNGFCTAAAFYYSFDTTSVYSATGANTYRTFKDQRTGQYLVGQQYSAPYPYPPYQNILVGTSDPGITALSDLQTQLPLKFTPDVDVLSNPSGAFRLAGVRNIKYFPESGTAGQQSNDMVLFRLSDIMLMRAECALRLGTDLSGALDLVNQIRERAYSGDNSHDWKMADLTLDNILAERGRELAWEGWRRNDLIRYEVAGGKPYYGATRVPGKKADPSDRHLNIFAIPAPQISANPKLKQNPGYN